jgi:hypothetical protein
LTNNIRRFSSLSLVVAWNKVEEDDDELQLLPANHEGYAPPVQLALADSLQ